MAKKNGKKAKVKKKLSQYEKDVLHNNSAPWQLKCEGCGATRRANETPILGARCAFCWSDHLLDDSWSRWWENQFCEARAFGARGSEFGSHQNHEIYAAKAARVALAAVLYDYKRNQTSPMVQGLKTLRGFVGERRFMLGYQDYAVKCLRDFKTAEKAKIRKHHRPQAEAVNQLRLFDS